MAKQHLGYYAAMQIAQGVAARHGIVRPRDLDEIGIPHQWLQHWDVLDLQRIGPGMYGLPRRILDIRVVWSRKYPNMTLGLTSALWTHGVLTEKPPLMWWVIGSKSRLPMLQLQYMRFARSSWPKEDREEVEINGMPIHCQSVLRAVLDCVRFRSKLGDGVAATALRRSLEAGAVTIDALKRRADELHVLAPLRRMLRDAATPLVVSG